jgi:hypothetical protein
MARNRGGRPRRDSSPIDIAVDDAHLDAPDVVADHGIYFSADGRRREEELLNISHKKRRVKPSDLADSFAEWIPVRVEDFENNQESEAQEVSIDVTVLGKRKKYASSVSELGLAMPALTFVRIIQCQNGARYRTSSRTNCSGMMASRMTRSIPAAVCAPRCMIRHLPTCRGSWRLSTSVAHVGRFCNVESAVWRSISAAHCT